MKRAVDGGAPAIGRDLPKCYACRLTLEISGTGTVSAGLTCPFVSHVNPSNRNLLHTLQAYSKLNQREESLNHLLGMDFAALQIETACSPMNI